MMRPSVTCVVTSDQGDTAVELSCTEAGILKARFCSADTRRNGVSHEEEIRPFGRRHAWFRDLFNRLQRYLGR